MVEHATVLHVKKSKIYIYIFEAKKSNIFPVSDAVVCNNYKKPWKYNFTIIQAEQRVTKKYR